ncbi:histone-like nucleoid-structuring protein Lsr2 [Krasilnikoviella flava]|uniref:Lsr2 protein n=1 Tax=Krasilnikoviella flava TaxID=526729 RepID=A0A1T5JQ67_9MICO|nr:Lsr2 family protein [Krasilnikoviella flava]SKC53504.1 Lsr2 protein [Krasilnikoviella flava]
MAQRIETTTYSDLSGAEGAEQYTFAVQDSSFEVDLTKDEAAELFRLLDPYVKAGRKISRRAARTVPTSRLNRQGTVGNPGIYGRVKDWGRANGFSVADRGRPSHALVEAYEKATGETVQVGK